MTTLALTCPPPKPWRSLTRQLLALAAAGVAGTGPAETGGATADEDAVWAAPLAGTVGPAGFESFYEAERRRVLAVVASLTGDRSAAEDIVQEAFATALRKWPTISRYDRPGDWVKRVAVNRAISRWRRRTAEERALRKVANARDPQAKAHDGEDPLWAAVRELPRRQAQVISLMFIDDLTIERTAETLGISTGAVKSHLHRAKTALAAALRPEAAR